MEDEEEEKNENIKLEDLFEPSDISKWYNKEIDIKIKTEDIPERL
jgi:hypothetical protein